MANSDFGTATLLTEPTNYAVVELPGRRFPGVVFQGDSLHALREELRALATIEDPEELRSEVALVAQGFDGIIAEYIEVATTQGHSLPFNP